MMTHHECIALLNSAKAMTGNDGFQKIIDRMEMTENLCRLSSVVSSGVPKGTYYNSPPLEKLLEHRNEELKEFFAAVKKWR